MGTDPSDSGALGDVTDRRRPRSREDYPSLDVSGYLQLVQAADGLAEFDEDSDDGVTAFEQLAGAALPMGQSFSHY